MVTVRGPPASHSLRVQGQPSRSGALSVPTTTAPLPLGAMGTSCHRASSTYVSEENERLKQEENSKEHEGATSAQTHGHVLSSKWPRVNGHAQRGLQCSPSEVPLAHGHLDAFIQQAPVHVRANETLEEVEQNSLGESRLCVAQKSFPERFIRPRAPLTMAPRHASAPVGV